VLGWLLVTTLWASEPVQRQVPVATANVRGLPWPLARRRRARLAATGRWLREGPAMVVGLQEVWRGGRALLDDERVHYPEGSRDSGLALYTSLPVRGPVRLVPFEAARGVDRLKAKGVLLATVELPGGQAVQVAVVHMQAGGSRRAAEVRHHQVAELLAALPAGPCLLMGDLNVYRDCPSDRRSLEALAAAGFDELAPQRPARGTSVYGAHRFDRLFVRAGPEGVLAAGGASVDTSVEVSDHYPVLGWVQSGRRRTRQALPPGG